MPWVGSLTFRALDASQGCSQEKTEGRKNEATVRTSLLHGMRRLEEAMLRGYPKSVGDLVQARVKYRRHDGYLPGGESPRLTAYLWYLNCAAPPSPHADDAPPTSPIQHSSARRSRTTMRGSLQHERKDHRQAPTPMALHTQTAIATGTIPDSFSTFGMLHAPDTLGARGKGTLPGRTFLEGLLVSLLGVWRSMVG